MMNGTSWDYRPLNHLIFTNESGTNCMLNSISPLPRWGNTYCGVYSSAICSNPPSTMLGNQRLVFKKTSMIDPTFHFWWNHTVERSVNKVPGFKIEWTIDNASHHQSLTLVTKELSGSVSTPGIGLEVRSAKTQNFPASNFLCAKAFRTKRVRHFLTTSLQKLSSHDKILEFWNLDNSGAVGKMLESVRKIEKSSGNI